MKGKRQLVRGDEFTPDAKIFVKNVIHADVLVETSHKKITDMIVQMKERLRNNGKRDFVRFLGSIAAAIHTANVDKIYFGMRLGRPEDSQAWQNLCDDTVLHAVARFVLWKRMIPIVTDVEKYMKL